MKQLRSLMLIAALLVANIFVSYADIKQDIEKANKKGKIVFLVVTEAGNSQNQSAMSLAQKTQKSVAKSVVVELDRGNAENSELVKKYGLSGAPAPLILVIATNGYVSGGSPITNLTAEKLVKLVPTPNEETVLKSINENKSVFVVFTNKNDKSSTLIGLVPHDTDSKNKKQIDVCQSACQSMGNKAVTVIVDISDNKEKSFMEKFNVDTKSEFPVTYVVNAQGNVSSMFYGITETKSLVTAAQKKSGGCCPAGSGKSCGPTKK